jgi:hypothetical protein
MDVRESNEQKRDKNTGLTKQSSPSMHDFMYRIRRAVHITMREVVEVPSIRLCVCVPNATNNTSASLTLPRPRKPNTHLFRSRIIPPRKIRRYANRGEILSQEGNGGYEPGEAAVPVLEGVALREEDVQPGGDGERAPFVAPGADPLLFKFCQHGKEEDKKLGTHPGLVTYILQLSIDRLGRTTLHIIHLALDKHALPRRGPSDPRIHVPRALHVDPRVLHQRLVDILDRPGGQKTRVLHNREEHLVRRQRILQDLLDEPLVLQTGLVRRLDQAVEYAPVENVLGRRAGEQEGALDLVRLDQQEVGELAPEVGGVQGEPDVRRGGRGRVEVRGEAALARGPPDFVEGRAVHDVR